MCYRNVISLGQRQALVLLHLLMTIALTAAARDLYVPEEYPTIQGAVDAAGAGDTIRIAPGVYEEQVSIVLKTIKLIGEPGVIVRATTHMSKILSTYGWFWNPLFGVYRSHVEIVNIEFQGMQLGHLYLAENNERLIGAYFLGSGGSVEGCSFSGFRGSSSSVSVEAYAIHVFNPMSTGSSDVDLQIKTNRFSDNAVSVILRGDPVNNPQIVRVTATVVGNSILGLQGTPILNFGMWIVTGVQAEISNNFIVGHYGWSDWLSAGVVAYDAAAGNLQRGFKPLFPLTFHGNTLASNGLHLMIVAGNWCRISNNNFLKVTVPGTSWGALALSGTGGIVENNNFVDAAVAITLLGNETLGVGWSPMVPATDSTIRDNFYCRVPEFVRMQPLVTDVNIYGNETCTNEDMRPRFQTIGHDGVNGRSIRLHSWNDARIVIEATTLIAPSNLVQWVPIHTNTLGTPVTECQDNTTNALFQRFYRAREP